MYYLTKLLLTCRQMFVLTVFKASSFCSHLNIPPVFFFLFNDDNHILASISVYNFFVLKFAKQA